MLPPTIFSVISVLFDFNIFYCAPDSYRDG